MGQTTVGVAGLGFLGRGIAACLLVNDFRVVGFTPDREAFAGVRSYIQKAAEEVVAANAVPAEIADSWQERYTETDSLRDFATCDFVIESVLEDLSVKKSVFQVLEEVVAPDVPIASNTSALPISLLQAYRKHPERFLGMHWAEPAYATRFLELIRGEQTGDAAFDKAVALAERLGKEPSVVRKDIPGFIVNRLGYAMYREALNLLELGIADVESIDRAFSNACGLWATFCGPFRWIDITGGPTLYGNAMRGVLPTLSTSATVPKVLEKMMENGDRGVLNGRGFYQYGPDDAPYWEALLHERAWVVHDLQKRTKPSGDPD
jgi:3-hydroxybutyryl-CoA dehydrogenase